MNSERNRQKLKIYEGEKGEGALVAVLSGEEAVKEGIEVNAPGAFLVYTETEGLNMAENARERNEDVTFSLTYKGL